MLSCVAGHTQDVVVCSKVARHVIPGPAGRAALSMTHSLTVVYVRKYS